MLRIDSPLNAAFRQSLVRDQQSTEFIHAITTECSDGNGGIWIAARISGEYRDIPMYSKRN
jgi:hypothetical protein